MKTKLEQLTVSQFVDLLCGNMNVLREHREMVKQSKLMTAMRNIVYEYKEISDKAGARHYLASIDEYVKAKIMFTVMSMCQYLVDIEQYDSARQIMESADIATDGMSGRRLAVEIKSRLERAKKIVEEAEEERHQEGLDPDAIRRSFDEQTASMMAYFKFQIDPDVMKATVYAHLVARQNRELKAQQAALKKK